MVQEFIANVFGLRHRQANRMEIKVPVTRSPLGVLWRTEVKPLNQNTSSQVLEKYTTLDKNSYFQRHLLRKITASEKVILHN